MNIINDILDLFDDFRVNNQIDNTNEFDALILQKKGIKDASIFNANLIFSNDNDNDNDCDSYYWFEISQHIQLPSQIEKSNGEAADFFKKFNCKDECSKLVGLAYTTKNKVECGKAPITEAEDFIEFLEEDYDEYQQSSNKKLFNNFFHKLFNTLKVAETKNFELKLMNILNHYASDSSLILENFFDEENSIFTNYLISFLAKHPEFALSQKTLEILEKHLSGFYDNELGKTKFFINHIHEIFSIFANQIIYEHNTSPEFINFFSKQIDNPNTDSNIQEELVSKFLDATTNGDIDLYLFSTKIIKIFEELMPKLKNNVKLILFLSHAIKKSNYQISSSSFPYFQKALYQGGNNKLLLEVISSYLSSELEQGDSKIQPTYNIISDIIANEYKLDISLIDKVIKDTANKNVNRFETILKSIEIYSRTDLSQHIDFFINELNEATTLSEKKEIIFILNKLNKAKYHIPDELYVFLNKLKDEEDISLQRVTYKLMKDLYPKLKLNDDHLYKEEKNSHSYIESSESTEAVERIKNYNISYKSIDRDGNTCLNILKTSAYSIQNENIRRSHDNYIKRLYDDNSFSSEYETEDILKQIDEKSNKDISKLINDGELNEMLLRIKKHENLLNVGISEFTFEVIDNKLFFRNNEKLDKITDDNSEAYKRVIHTLSKTHKYIKPEDMSYINNLIKEQYHIDFIHNWSKEDFSDWGHKIRDQKITDENIAEVITVLKFVAHKTLFKEKYFPRDTQVITALILFKSDHGRLGQVYTGEGKSVIIDMLSALMVFDGHKVDIITSSRELAERDSDEQKPFYDYLGITVANNLASQITPKDAYKCDVVYGDLLNFIADNINDAKHNTKNGRGFDFAIIDESDNLFIDQKSTMVRLTTPNPGFNKLINIYFHMWGAMHAYPQVKEHLCPSSENECLYEDIHNYLTDYTAKHLLDTEDGKVDSRNVVTPIHLEKYIKEQQYNWIESAVRAVITNEKEDYLVASRTEERVYNGKFIVDELPIIAPVDTQVTGTVQMSTKWSNAFDQFLSLKHNLIVSEESLLSEFQSYLRYFQNYSGKLYGLTGTLGEKVHQDFLKEYYDVDFVHIPSFKPNKRVIFPEIFQNNAEDWMDSIIGETFKRGIGKASEKEIIHGNHRPVLIIAKTIRLVEQIKKSLLNANYPEELLVTYTEGTKVQKSYIEGSIILPGQIIIATNLAGRGTDIKVSKEAEANGGLHVILTYYPDSIRTFDQGVGRCARKGEDGSARLIVMETEYGNIEDLVESYNKLEQEKFDLDKSCHIPSTSIQDSLYENFLFELQKYTSPNGYTIKISFNKPERLESNILFIYEERETIILAGILPDNSVKTIDLLELNIKELNENAYKHILDVLKKKNPANRFNNEAKEIIYFLATANNFIYNSDYAISKDIFRVKKDRTSLFKTLSSEKSFYDRDDLISTITYYRAWKEYRQLYNNNAETKQLTAIWAEFFYFTTPLLDHFSDACDPYDGNAEKLFNKIKPQIEKSFNDDFIMKVADDFKKDEFFSNPAYLLEKAENYILIHGSEEFKYTQTSPLNTAMTLTDKAIGKDHSFAWHGYLQKIIIRFYLSEHIKDAKKDKDAAYKVKSETLADLQRVYQGISDEKDNYEGSFFAMAIYKQIPEDSFLMAQFIYTLNTYDILLDTTEENIKKVHETLSNPKKYIHIGKHLSIHEQLNNTNLTTAYEKSFSTTSLSTLKAGVDDLDIKAIGSSFEGNLLFKKTMLGNVNGLLEHSWMIRIDDHDLNVKKDWTGTVFSGVFGFAQIFVGLGLTAMTGGFAVSFGFSMIVSGMSDIVSATFSVINDQPIELGEYFKSKAVTYAVAVVSAGIMHMAELQMLQTTDKVIDATGKVTEVTRAMTSAEIIGQAALSTALGYGVAYAANYAAAELVDSNDGAIESSARNAINKLINAHLENIELMYIEDMLDVSPHHYMNIMNKATLSLKNCQAKFHDIFTSVGKGAAGAKVTTISSNPFVTAGVNFATTATIGMIKYYQFTGEFTNKVGSHISSEASHNHNVNPADLMRAKLKDQLKYVSAVNQVMDALTVHGITDGNHNFDFNRCAEIGRYDKNAFTIDYFYSKTALDIKEVELLCNEIKEKKDRYLNSIKENLSNMLFLGMKSTITHDVAAPGFEFGINAAFSGLQKLFKEGNNQEGSNKEEGNNNQKGSNKEEGSNNQKGSNKEEGSNNQKESNKEEGSNNQKESNKEEGSNNQKESNKEEENNNQKGGNKEDSRDNVKNNVGKNAPASDRPRTPDKVESTTSSKNTKQEDQNSHTSSVKGEKAYDETVGPKQPFAKGLIDAGHKIDAMDFSEDTKIQMKSDLSQALNEYSNAPDKTQEELLQTLNRDGNLGREFEWKDLLHLFPFYPSKAEAAVPIVAAGAGAAIRSCAMNPACRGLFLEAAANLRAVARIVPIIDSIFDNDDKVTQETNVDGTFYEKRQNSENDVKHKSNKFSSSSGTGMPDPDKEPNKFKEWVKKFEKYHKKDGSDRYDCPKADSPQWGKYQNYRQGGLRTNGLKGKDQRFYEFDTTHNDIQVTDRNAIDLGSLDPVTGKTYRAATYMKDIRIWNKIK